MFLGQYRLSLGDDRSMVIPGAFQEALAHGAYITRGFEQNLLIMTDEEFKATSERVAALNMADPAVRLLNRLILAHATALDIDTNGRGLIPDELAAFAGLHEEIILVGQGDYIEAWSPEAWKKQTEQLLDFETNSSRFAQLDLSLA